MQSKAKTVEEYLESLPEDRRKQIVKVRKVILDNLPAGYEEAMNWGMISYQIPLTLYPSTYNKQPLSYAALASQKNHMAVYLSGIYGDPDMRKDFEAKYEETGLKMDIGKSCVRFQDVKNLPLELIGEAISAITPGEFIKIYEESRKR